jgi:hypothetical protein
MTNPRARIWLAPAILLLAGTTTIAQGRTPPGVSGNQFGLMVQTDLDYGGDDLATVSFTNGKSQDVKAGQGVVVSGGLHFRPDDSTPFDVQALIGFKYVTTAASNADINVTRAVFQLLGDYQFSSGWYLGGGVVRHSGTKLDGDGFFRDVEFDDATGFTVESGWRWVGLHYTHIEYKNDFVSGVDASSVGIRVNYRF